VASTTRRSYIPHTSLQSQYTPPRRKINLYPVHSLVLPAQCAKMQLSTDPSHQTTCSLCQYSPPTKLHWIVGVPILQESGEASQGPDAAVSSCKRYSKITHRSSNSYKASGDVHRRCPPPLRLSRSWSLADSTPVRSPSMTKLCGQQWIHCGKCSFLPSACRLVNDNQLMRRAPMFTENALGPPILQAKLDTSSEMRAASLSDK
jgi:hypothetical protein